MPEALDTYSAWLERGFSADMEYLKRDPQRRVTPSMTFAPARSILIVSVNYYNSPPPPPENMVWGRVAGYAVGLDYHNVLRAKLRDLFALIEKEVGHPLSRRAVTDDAALFEQALAAHERLVGQALGLPRVREVWFADFWGEIKSLGAWGGDFVLGTSVRPEEEVRSYFQKRGFGTVLTWKEMVG